MSMIARSTSSNSVPQQEVLDAETYPGTLAWAICLGVHPQPKYDGNVKPPADKLFLSYQISGSFCLDENGEEMPDKPRFVNEDMAFHDLSKDKAKSTQRYLVLDPKREFKGDWFELVGKGCAVTTNQYQDKKKNIRNGVSSTSGLMVGIPVTPLVNPPIKFNFYSPDLETFERLPEWMQDKAKAALNYKGSKLEELLEGQSEASDEVVSNPPVEVGNVDNGGMI